MLATLEVNAFTDSPRNLTVTVSKQGTARMIGLLLSVQLLYFMQKGQR